jgi:hypothetical protein
MQCENRELRYPTRCVTGDARTDRRCPHREYRSHQNALQYVKVVESRFIDANRHAIPGSARRMQRMHRGAGRCGLHAITRRTYTPMCASRDHPAAFRCTHPRRDFIAFFIGESRGPRHRRMPTDHASRTASRGAARPRIRVPSRGAAIAPSHPPPPASHAGNTRRPVVRPGMTLPAYCDLRGVARRRAAPFIGWRRRSRSASFRSAPVIWRGFFSSGLE